MRDSTRASPRIDLPDTTLQVNFRNARIGFNSFVFQNFTRYQQAWHRHKMTAMAGNNALYNQNLGAGGGRFVQQDYYWLGNYAYGLRPNLDFGATTQATGLLPTVTGS